MGVGDLRVRVGAAVAPWYRAAEGAHATAVAAVRHVGHPARRRARHLLPVRLRAPSSTAAASAVVVHDDCGQRWERSARPGRPAAHRALRHAAAGLDSPTSFHRWRRGGSGRGASRARRADRTRRAMVRDGRNITIIAAAAPVAGAGQGRRQGWQRPPVVRHQRAPAIVVVAAAAVGLGARRQRRRAGVGWPPHPWPVLTLSSWHRALWWRWC